MTDAILSVGLDSKAVVSGEQQAVKSLTRVRAEFQKTNQVTQQFNQTLLSLQKATRIVDGPLGGLAARFETVNSVLKTGRPELVAFTLGLAAVTLAIRELVTRGEEFTRFTNRLRLVTDSTTELVYVQDRLFEIAQKTRNSLEATGDLYARLARGTKNFGVAQKDLLIATEAINKAVTLSYTSTQSAAAALFQLGQGLSANALRGQELNSVLEQTPRVAQAIADGLGVSLGKLREIAKEGGLTAKVVLDAIVKQAPILEREFAKALPTVTQSFVVLNNAVTKLFGTFDQSAGVTQRFSKIIISLADNLETVVSVFEVLVVLVASRVTASLILATGALTANSLAAIRAAATARTAAGAYLFLAGSAETAAAGVGLLNGVLAFLGGPAGIAITGAAAGIYYFATRTSEAEKQTQNFHGSLKAVSDAFFDMGKPLSEATEKEKKYIEAKIASAEATFFQINAERQLAAQRLRDLIQFGEEVVEPRTGAIYHRKLSPGAEKTARQDLNDINEGIISLAAEMSNVYSLGKDKPLPIQEAAKTAAKEVNNLKKALDSLVQETRTPEEKYFARLAELAKLRNDLARQGIKLTYEQNQAFDRGAKKALDDLEKTLAEANPLTKVLEDTASDVRNSFKDAFKDIYSDGTVSFRSLADKVKDIFTDLLASLSVLAISKPIIIPFVQGVGGALGVPGGQLNQITRQFGGDALSTANSAFSLAGLGGRLIAPGGFLAGGLDRLGGAIGYGGGVYGPPAPLSGAFSVGGAVSGFAGNLLGNALFGNRGVGASVGGALGGIGGSLAAAALTPVLGPLAPFVAPFLGSLAGNALGGLFGGNKPSSKLQTGQVDLFSGALTGRTGLTGDKFSQENFDAVTQLTGFAAQIANAFTKGKGLKETLDVAVGARGGYQARFGGQGDFGPGTSDIGEFIGTLVRGIAEKTVGLSQTVQTALKSIDFKDFEAGMKDLNFTLALDNLDFVPDKFSAMEQALRDLNTQVTEAEKTARRLGLAESDIARIYAARDQQLTNLRTEFNTGIRGRILGITNPGQLALENLDAEFATIRREAIALGADLVQVERAYGLQRLKVIEENQGQQLEALKNSYLDIRRFRESILVSGSVSGLSRENRRLEALRQFGDVKVRFATGEASFSDVQTSVNNLLDASKDYFSFSEGYYADQASAVSFLQSIEDQAKNQVDAQDLLLTEAQKQTAILEGILTGISQQLVGAVEKSGDSRLLRAGETLAGLSDSFNAKNQLPELLVRQFKLQSGFDFSANPNRTFAEFAKSNPAALELFNSLVKAVGGIPQYASGGVSSGGMAWVGENGPELVDLPRGAQVYSSARSQSIASNDNSPVVQAVLMVVDQVVRLRDQTAAQAKQTAEDMENLALRLSGIEKAASRSMQRRAEA